MSRRVLITAGASGIGYAMATAFAAEGDRVWITDVDAGALAEAPAEWQRTECNSADDAAMQALEQAVLAEWGGLDVLVANAGIKGPTAGIEEMDRAEWDACVGVNLTGAMLAARLGARLMLPAGSGVITFLSSTSGLHGTPFRTPYSAAKWGVIGLMKSVAMELGPKGIRANAICPGSVNGPRIDRVIEAEAAAKGMTPDAVREGYASGTALKRLSGASDVADMALFLASDRARMITGQAMAVDGYTYNVDP
ncbi:SDR family oxidoreductase [Pararhodobacter sp. CCB-MM2]|uniref:SDR family oxidoreductase n=1 Tax=Pararhodobacter sp. CCB-MM2 TaxID=1786003 RepID=UPI00082A2F33|nr:SDR family oxidoreductase [Pararhodobacter sp. CCB-MM2]